MDGNRLKPDGHLNAWVEGTRATEELRDAMLILNAAQMERLAIDEGIGR